MSHSKRNSHGPTPASAVCDGLTRQGLPCCFVAHRSKPPRNQTLTAVAL